MERGTDLKSSFKAIVISLWTFWTVGAINSIQSSCQKKTTTVLINTYRSVESDTPLSTDLFSTVGIVQIAEFALAQMASRAILKRSR